MIESRVTAELIIANKVLSTTEEFKEFTVEDISESLGEELSSFFECEDTKRFYLGRMLDIMVGLGLLNTNETKLSYIRSDIG